MLSEDGLRRINMKENRKPTEDYLTNLINKSEVLEDEEKWYWIDLLPTMQEDHLRRLFSILTLDEYDKLKEFNKTFMTNYEEKKNK